jgi:stage III sporulation protein AH
VVASYDPLIEYRLARDIARENARIGLERLANSGSVDASIELLNQTRNVSKEEELESILKAKGFGDTVITIEDNMVKVIAKDLNKQKVEAIAEIIYNLTTFGKDQIVLTSI